MGAPGQYKLFPVERSPLNVASYEIQYEIVTQHLEMIRYMRKLPNGLRQHWAPVALLLAWIYCYPSMDK